jgi:hypothetical protein
LKENFVTPQHDEPPPPASITATLHYAQIQKAARDAETDNWRYLRDDGSLPEDGSAVMSRSLVHATMSMSTEVKKRLPDTGVQWFYLRSEIKAI